MQRKINFGKFVGVVYSQERQHLTALLIGRPDLLEGLQANTPWDEVLAHVAAHYNIVLDGYYDEKDMDNLAGLLARRIERDPKYF